MKRIVLAGVVVVVFAYALLSGALDPGARSAVSRKGDSTLPLPSARDGSIQAGEPQRIALAAKTGLPALPPRDMPASISYQQLKERADAGDSRAACRLAFELLRCQALTSEHDAITKWLEEREARIAGLNMPEGANEVASRQLEIAERQADCRKLPGPAMSEGAEYLYRAAQAGNAEAQVRYLSGQMFGMVAEGGLTVSDKSYLRHPEFERWRQQAPRFADRLVRSHPAVGLSMMANAYGADELPFDALIEDDRLRRWAYVEAVRRQVGRPPRSADQFDAESQRRIAEIDRELSTLRFQPEEAEQALMDSTVGPGMTLGDAGGASCD